MYAIAKYVINSLIGSGGPPPPETFFLLMETGEYLLQENGDKYFAEYAP
jgi:hypothetical protein